LKPPTTWRGIGNLRRRGKWLSLCFGGSAVYLSDNPIRRFGRCIGGAAVGKHRVGGFIALVVFGAFGVTGARADELTSAPAAFITGPVSSLQWTGVYFGVDAGYGWSSSSAVLAPDDHAAQAGTSGVGKGTGIPFADYLTRGPLAGGQVGYNWQINPLWVTGIEADYQWAGLSGEGISPFHLGNVGAAGPSSDAIVQQAIKSFGTLRLRMGVVPYNPVVVYATGGLAFGQVNETVSILTSGSAVSPTSVLPAIRASPARRRRRCSGGRSAPAASLR
jgi:opacity protein-like surface antigen